MALEFKTRTQVVVEAIRSQILSGQIKAGEPLRQAALAEQLNVSRIPIREALLQLEAEGLVKFEPHKGATATEISPELIDELFDHLLIVVEIVNQHRLHGSGGIVKPQRLHHVITG